MVALRLERFLGMIPVVDTRLLPPQASAENVNMRSDAGGALRGLGGPKPAKTLKPNTRTVFRLPTGPDAADLYGDSFWMEFDDEHTNVSRGPTINDSFERYYWASPSTGLRFASKEMILGQQIQGLEVGVVPTTTKPLVETVAGTGTIDPETGKSTAPVVVRSYVVTYINVYGEESQPSPPAEGSGPSDADWLIRDIPPSPPQGGHAMLKEIRLYRTVVGTSGTTTFFKVADLPLGTPTYTDRISDTIVSGQVQITSIQNALPPEGVEGLIAMPNGILVAWKDNNLYFSENYKPYSWPAEYTITVEHKIVGLGVFGSSLVVCTTGRPAVVSGVRADTMSLSSHTVSLPCLSRASIVSTPNGVIYASDSGLIMMGPAGISSVTDAVIGREKWIGEYRPRELKGFYWDGDYTALRPDGTGFSITPGAEAGVRLLDVGPVTHAGNEVYSGRPWVIRDRAVHEFSPQGATPLPYRWRSKTFHLPRPVNLKVGQLFFDTEGLSEDDELVRLRVWIVGNGAVGAQRRLVLDHGFTAADSGRVFMLPTGFKSDIWTFEIEGTAPLHSAAIATSVQELAGV